MLPYRVYQPQELEALSPVAPLAMGDGRRSPQEGRKDAGPTDGGGLRTLFAALARLVGRTRLRRPAPGTI